MLWIHGGGNVIGHAGFYDGGRLAEERGVVVVAINYRLGPLGWLHNWALRSDARIDDDVSGNFATLDMIRALEWTRENIAAFGGNPHNVTIFGESAGGTNVFSLLLSPRASGLFQRAIVQSGGTRISTLAEAEDFMDDLTPGSEASSNEVLLLLLQADGRAGDRASAKALLASMSRPEIAQYLRDKSAAEFLEIYRSNFGQGGFLRAPLLAGDGIVLPVEPPLERLADASGWNVVPVMLGTNRDEDKLFMFGDPKWVKQWLGFLPRLRDPEGFELQARYSSQMWRARGVDEPGAAMRNVSPAVYTYRFDWDDEPSRLGTDLSQMLGAAHGFEIPFVFGHYDLGKAGNVIFTRGNLEGREQLADAMMSYWTEFARTGDPGRGREGQLPRWDAWPPAGGTAEFMRLDVPSEGGLTMTPGFATESVVLARAVSDPALSARPDRCAILEQVAARSATSLPADCVDATVAKHGD
jgi:para-nitrobenzyl esterase